ncbi:unnamed protein product [Cuscuta europaea]|uniref:Uncharacterized protein n=1 Tax=Cuscuta europaea TaxID=41803 RepID=A0A9P0Z8Q4_CUSEU|nr:unnamed protein product [Cuscuta europaea]
MLFAWPRADHVQRAKMRGGLAVKDGGVVDRVDAEAKPNCNAKGLKSGVYDRRGPHDLDMPDRCRSKGMVTIALYYGVFAALFVLPLNSDSEFREDGDKAASLLMGTDFGMQ